MQYKNTILENKTFNIFKEIFEKLVYSVGFLVLFCAIMIMVFNFKPYKVESDSQSPVFTRRDIVIVKAQNEYKVGDIINFMESGASVYTAHRLIAITTDDVSGKTYYICHGDNVQSCQPGVQGLRNWEEDAEAVKGLSYQQLKSGGFQNLQYVQKNEITGKIMCKLTNFHIFYDFIMDNLIMIALTVLCLWELVNCLDVEISIRKQFRMLG